MSQETIFIIITILFAYLFDLINGFHDAGNTIATIVTTGVLTPRQAVLWSAFFNLIAFLFFNLMVARTIGTGLIDPTVMSTNLIFSALIGAISWNIITWYFGLPSSSSHALIGGLTGASIAIGGMSVLTLSGFTKVAIGLCLSPILGLIMGLLLTLVFTNLFHLLSHRTFKNLQLISSAFLSLTHGGNDAQKTMGIITTLLFSASALEGSFHVPLWVVVSCQLMISLGTLMGGWRIVRTMGTQITSLTPLKGSAAEAASALIIFAATDCGIPVSTTQTVTGAIAGVGLIKGSQGTNWSIIRVILLSWVLTIPASGLIAAMVHITLIYGLT